MQRDVSDIFRSRDFFYYNRLKNIDGNADKMSESEIKKKIQGQIDTMITNIGLPAQQREIVKMLYRAEGPF